MFTIQNTQIAFVSINAAPYTHRVIIDGIARDWHRGDYEANAKAAKYYYSKHILKVSDQKLLKKAMKKAPRVQAWSKEGFAQWLLNHNFDIVGSGDWRSDSLPLERYIAEMKQAGTWKKGQFLHDGLYQNRAKWMYRFNNYYQSLEKHDLYGCEVREILQSGTWNSKQFD